MANKEPFKVNRDDFPTSDLRSFFNPKHCFAQGNFEKTGNHIALGGRCRVVQFGRNPQGKNCMFVLDGNVSQSVRPNPMMAMSLEFDHMGRVDNARFGNGAVEWSMNIPDVTHASFGYLPQPPPPPKQHRGELKPDEKTRINAINARLQHEKATISQEDRDALVTEKKNIIQGAVQQQQASVQLVWGCTRVLKGSFNFFGCERNRSGEKRANPFIEVVDGHPYVSCVQASRDIDIKFQMSPEDISKIQPFFAHDFVNGVVRYGTHSAQFYDGEGFGNLYGIAGHDSFVHLNPNGIITAVETRNGHPVKPIPRHLSVLVPETRTKFEAKLKEGVATLKTDMKALRWLASHPLEFPAGEITQPFVNDAFGWVQELSMQCKSHLDLKASHPAFPRRTPQSLATGMSGHLFKMLTTPRFPDSSKKIMKCKCTATEHDKLCKNAICPWYVKLESDGFIWPRFEFEPNAEQDRLRVEKQTEKASASAAAASASAAASATASKAAVSRPRKASAQASAAPAASRKRSSAQASAAQASAAPAPASADPKSSKRSKKGGTRTRRRLRRR